MYGMVTRDAFTGLPGTRSPLMSQSRTPIESSHESLSRDELRALQDKRLRETVAYAYENVELYRTAFDEAGVDPAAIDGSMISP